MADLDWLDKYIALERANRKAAGISEEDWRFYSELIGDYTEDEIAAMDEAALKRIYEGAQRG